MPRDSELETTRLRLRALSPDEARALRRGDGRSLRETTGARFPDAPTAPPLLGEDLEALASAIAAEPGGPAGAELWLVIRRNDDVPVAFVGTFRQSTRAGVVLVGYSVYPEHQGRGYATEALSAVRDHAWSDPSVQILRATIPPWNAPSLRVAAKVGMRRVGTARDPQVGDVEVYELTRELTAEAARATAQPRVAPRDTA